MADLMTRDEMAALLEAARIGTFMYNVSPAEWEVIAHARDVLFLESKRLAATAVTAIDEVTRLQNELAEAHQQIAYLREQLLAESNNMDRLLFLNGSLEAATEALQAVSWRKTNSLRAPLERMTDVKPCAAIDYIIRFDPFRPADHPRWTLIGPAGRIGDYHHLMEAKAAIPDEVSNG